MLLIFSVPLLVLAWLFAEMAWVKFGYKQGQCVILGVTNTLADGRYGSRHVRFKTRVIVDGVAYEGVGYGPIYAHSVPKGEAAGLMQQYTIGSAYPCWYNPLNPRSIVLTREISDYHFAEMLLGVATFGAFVSALLYHLLRGRKKFRREAAAAKDGERGGVTGGAEGQ
jgi:hypothetical protein